MSKLSVHFYLCIIVLMVKSIIGIELYVAQNFTQLIMGGYKPLTRDLDKYIVSLRQRGDPLSHFCAGSIIKPHVVITAAHCIQSPGVELENIVVVAGTTNRLKETPLTQVVTVRDAILQQYDQSTMENDICILILSEDLIFDSQVIDGLPLPLGPAQPGLNCTVIGWGTLFEKGPLSAELVWANIQVWPLANCMIVNPNMRKGMLCASDLTDTEKDSCLGDSGGPLVCNAKLVGIVSHGIGCGNPVVPGIYTDIYSYRDWIIRSIATKNSSHFLILLAFLLALLFLSQNVRIPMHLPTIYKFK